MRSVASGDLVSRLVDSIKARSGSRKTWVVVIGDAMTDHWVYGNTETCQEGCPKLTAERTVSTPGGAANAEQCLKHWGVNTHLASYHRSVWPDKYRFVDPYLYPVGAVVVRWDDETALRAAGSSPPDWRYTLNLAFEMIRHAAGVLLSDYRKGFLTPEVVSKVVAACRTEGIPCLVDAHCGVEPAAYAGAVLKCNEEYQHLHNDALSQLVYDSDDGADLVVTAGPLNPAVWERGKLVKGFKFLPPVQCVNHVGAGDCFAAHLTLALAHGFTLRDAAALAHSAGRVYVQGPRNRAPRPSEVAADMALASSILTTSTSTP